MSKTLVDRLILGFFIAILFVFHQFGYIGHYGFDDMQYAELASKLLNGEFDFKDHFSFRLTILLFTAASYSIFGINDFASSLPSLLVTSSILLMIYQIFKKEKSYLLFIALSLSTLSSWFLNYSDKLMPDMYLTACIMLSFFLFYRYRYSRETKNELLYGGLFSFSLFLGFCSKGTIVLLVPWLLFLFISDFLKHKDFKFWTSVVLSGMGFLAIYFFIIYALTGDAEQRFEAIASNSYLNRCSYDQQSLKILAKRLLIELPRLFIKEGMLVSYLFIIPVFLLQFLSKKESIAANKKYAMNSAVTLLLSANFMTISATSYVPMCVDIRHFLFIIPIAAIAAAFAIQSLFKDKKQMILYLGICLSLVLIMSLGISGNYLKTYIALLILGLIFYFLNQKLSFWTFALLLALTLGYNNYSFIQYAGGVNYQQQKEIIKNEVLSIKEPSYVITNEVQKRIGRYFQAFKPHPVQWLSYDQFDSDTLEKQAIYLLENQYMRNLMAYSENDLPLYVRIESEQDKKIYSNEELGIRLLKLEKLRDPEKDGKTILKSLNGFEKTIPFWKQDNNHLNSELSLEGNHSILCPSYSSTFSYELNPIKDSIEGNLFIKTKVNCWTGDATKTTIVISIEDKDGAAYLYQSKPINKYLKSYSNWWPIELNALISAEEIKNNSTLKIYLHNPDQNTIFLDNFEVELMNLN